MTYIYTYTSFRDSCTVTNVETGHRGRHLCMCGQAYIHTIGVDPDIRTRGDRAQRSTLVYTVTYVYAACICMWMPDHMHTHKGDADAYGYVYMYVYMHTHTGDADVETAQVDSAGRRIFSKARRPRTAPTHPSTHPP